MSYHHPKDMSGYVRRYVRPLTMALVGSDLMIFRCTPCRRRSINVLKHQDAEMAVSGVQALHQSRRGSTCGGGCGSRPPDSHPRTDGGARKGGVRKSGQKPAHDLRGKNVIWKQTPAEAVQPGRAAHRAARCCRPLCRPLYRPLCRSAW